MDFASKNSGFNRPCVGRVAGPGIVNLGPTEGKLNGLVRAPLEFLLLVARGPSPWMARILSGKSPRFDDKT